MYFFLSCDKQRKENIFCNRVLPLHLCTAISPENPLGCYSIMGLNYWSAQILIAHILSFFFQWRRHFGPGFMVCFSPVVKRGKTKVISWSSYLVLCHVNNTAFLACQCPGSLMSGFPMIVELPWGSQMGFHSMKHLSTRADPCSLCHRTQKQYYFYFYHISVLLWTVESWLSLCRTHICMSCSVLFLGRMFCRPFLIKAVHQLCTQNRTCVGFRFCKLRLKWDVRPSQLMGRMNTLSTKTLQLLWRWVKQLWGSVFKHRHAYVPWGFCFFPFFSSAVLRFWCSAWPSQPSPPVTAAVHCRICCLSFLLEGWLLVTSSVTELHLSFPFSWI